MNITDSNNGNGSIQYVNRCTKINVVFVEPCFIVKFIKKSNKMTLLLLVPVLLVLILLLLLLILLLLLLLLLPLPLQPTVGFGLSNNTSPFFPIHHQLSPSTHSQLLLISFYFFSPSFLGLPLRLVPSSSWVKIFLGILSFSILSRWPSQLILCPFIHFTIFSPLFKTSSSRFVLLFHSPSSYLGPYILLNIFLSKISKTCSSFFVIVHVSALYVTTGLINKMQQSIKFLLVYIYVNLNMFRAIHRPSSGA